MFEGVTCCAFYHKNSKTLSLYRTMACQIKKNYNYKRNQFVLICISLQMNVTKAYIHIQLGTLEHGQWQNVWYFTSVNHNNGFGKSN